jgi:serine/threonine protein kinase
MPGEPDPAAEGLEDTFGLVPDSTSASPNETQSARRIGPYRLLQLVGEGGMGEVWLAEQVEPIRRKVAIKVIKVGMDTKQVVARFESERQALALMDHAAIAKIFDGGSTLEGRPYFVMEYVAGVSITDHCDEHKLSTPQRLELFAEVCAGVQHAHQKAIIHRDLKPSNVLVSLVDGKAQPKIIDFGIAKATGYRLTEKTLFTELGAVIGTPEYMSPEQADLTNQDIDTRTDVYSLGVILYQLLTGELPFASKDLRASSYAELRRKLKDQEPPKPSTRLKTLGDGLTDTAKNRNTDSVSLQRQLKGDLDAIVMKALEKERARRYGSPAELAADIRRHLGHEPVLARPSSQGYRLQTYVRRHRLGVAVTTGLVLVLVGFAVAMALQLKRIAAERDRANAWVEHAKEFAGKPQHDHSMMRGTLAPADAKTLDALLWKARELLNHGDFVAAEQLLRDTLVLAHRMVNSESFMTLWARNLLAEALMEQRRLDEAEALLRETQPIAQRVGPDFVSHWTSVNLARVLVRHSRLDEALSVLRQAFENGLSGNVFLPMYMDLSKVDAAADFAALRREPRFNALMVEQEKQHRMVELMASNARAPPYAQKLSTSLSMGSLEHGNVSGLGEDVSTLRWVSSDAAARPAPYDSGPTTKEGEHTLSICRGLYSGPSLEDGAPTEFLVIGKTWAGADGCKAPLFGLEVTFSRFERLVGPGGEWKPGRAHSYPPRSVIGGYSADGSLYLICKAEQANGSWHPGTFPADRPAACAFGFAGSAEEKSDYWILVTSDESLPNTQDRSHRAE